MTGAFLKINNQTVSVPPKYKEGYDPKENVGESEAGTDLVDVTRLNKRVIHLSWKGVYSDFIAILEGWSNSATVTVQFNGGTAFTARARDFEKELIEKSYLYTASDGIWNASLTLYEI